VQNVKINVYEDGLPSLYSLLAHIHLDFLSPLSQAVFTRFPPPHDQQYFIAARPSLTVRLALLSAIMSPQHLASTHSKVKRES